MKTNYHMHTKRCNHAIGEEEEYIVNAIQAPTMSIWAEYFSKVLLEAGTCILLVFKLIKKKK